jgi:hypothetical protein
MLASSLLRKGTKTGTCTAFLHVLEDTDLVRDGPYVLGNLEGGGGQSEGSDLLGSNNVVLTPEHNPSFLPVNHSSQLLVCSLYGTCDPFHNYDPFHATCDPCQANYDPLCSVSHICDPSLVSCFSLSHNLWFFTHNL